MLNKHAYRIMTHGNFEILKFQLKMLDDTRNDIFIHVDKKVKDFPFYEYKKICKYSKIIFIDKRINVKKGGRGSQVKTELELFKKAAETKHFYYHLISGVDLPLKNQNKYMIFL